MNCFTFPLAQPVVLHLYLSNLLNLETIQIYIFTALLMLLFRFESALSWPPVELQPAGAGGGGGQLSGRPATERSEGRWPRAQLHAARPPCTGSCHSVVVPTSGEGGGGGGSETSWF